MYTDVEFFEDGEDEMVFEYKVENYEDDKDLYKTEIILSDQDEYINKIIDAVNTYNDIMKKLDNIHYEDNIYCSRYLGDYIENYVMRFLGGEDIPSEMEDRRDGILRRPIDFLLDYNGTKLKIKHVSGCLIYGSFSNKNSFFWKFDVDYNYHPDAFILSAWDTRKSLKPQYMWIIMKDQKFNHTPFWNRNVLLLEDTKKRINFMKQFEMKGVRLGLLQNIVAHAKKKDMISYLIDIRRDVYMKTGIDINLRKLARAALLRGLNKI